MVEDNFTEIEPDSESVHPASREKPEEEEKKSSKEPEEQEQAELSEEDDDEDNNPVQIALNKQALLEWVTMADFTQDLSLT